MIIKEGTAEDIHNWFITEKTDEIVLCIFLGASKMDVDLLGRLIEQASHIDGVMGRKIGFLLCADGLQAASTVGQSGGRETIINGVYKRPVAEPLVARDFISEFNMERLRNGGQPADKEYYRDASKALAQSTARMVPDFMELYGISRSELPCLITLVKGVHTFNVTKCPAEPREEDLLNWLEDVAGLIERVERDLLLKDFEAPEILERIKASKGHAGEAEAKLKKIEKAARGIVTKYASSVDEALPTVSALSSSELNEEQKSVVMQSFLSDFPAAKLDNRWPKIFILQKRIDSLREEEFGSLDRQSAKSLAEKLSDEKNKLEAIHTAISSLSCSNGGSRVSRRGATPRRPENNWETVDRVNTATDLVYKINDAIKFVARFLAIGG